ncbi:UbiA family prenyltransferase [Riemerella columbipharyngis]|uniref:4-hydroxybenzoate polyprenyltransferase n=1 Tax=Riemerella columbipharyngis TaxID=1071918 RepID=A0A1G7B357_9FLAO|nr:UbiA family prenyltransferase [Riemerella columbipharyngis]SDE21350.1 4-hydroxybenzoate polyprenyltransferase [Riemerella columbipharyngis]
MFPTQQNINKKVHASGWLYRTSQFISLLSGARFFVLIFFGFTLYVSTLFLFMQEESLRNVVFDYKVHGIILCSMLSIAAGGIINHFYDKEKDRLEKPLRFFLQSFLKQKYFLYSYILLNVLSLGIAIALSFRIFMFFLVYQFLIWLYSHKLSKILIINNLSHVSLSLYPFSGMMVYFRHFSLKLAAMAMFLFLILLIIDILKDIVSFRIDKVLGYPTLPTVFGVSATRKMLFVLVGLNIISAFTVVVLQVHFSFLSAYFTLSVLMMSVLFYPLFCVKFFKMYWLMNLLRVWVFIGVVFMLLNGIYEHYLL